MSGVGRSVGRRLIFGPEEVTEEAADELPELVWPP